MVNRMDFFCFVFLFVYFREKRSFSFTDFVFFFLYFLYRLRALSIRSCFFLFLFHPTFFPAIFFVSFSLSAILMILLQKFFFFSRILCQTFSVTLYFFFCFPPIMGLLFFKLSAFHNTATKERGSEQQMSEKYSLWRNCLYNSLSICFENICSLALSVSRYRHFVELFFRFFLFRLFSKYILHFQCFYDFFWQC